MYVNIVQFFSQHRIVKRDAAKWRLTKPIVGGINGLGGESVDTSDSTDTLTPGGAKHTRGSFRGVLVATNGIMCFIEDEHGVLREGHFDWFVPDSVEPIITTDGVELRPAVRPKKDLAKELLDMIEV